jgi:hypothetical protein
MVTFLKAVRKRPLLSVVVANMLGLVLPANSALADNPSREQAQEISSKSPATSSERSGSARTPLRKPMRTPDRSGNFVYEIINNIRTRSEELSAHYGGPTDCLEEAKVCLTMRDTDDNQVRLCLNTVPGDSGGDAGEVQKSSVRR